MLVRNLVMLRQAFVKRMHELSLVISLAIVRSYLLLLSLCNTIDVLMEWCRCRSRYCSYSHLVNLQMVDLMTRLVRSYLISSFILVCVSEVVVVVIVIVVIEYLLT